MRKQVFLHTVFLFLFIITAMVFPADKIKIGFLRQLEIQPFIKQTEGAIKVLEENGYTTDKAEIIQTTANGKMAEIKNIIDTMKKNKVKVIIPIGTSVSLEVLKLVKDIPVVACVTYGETLKEAKTQFKLGNNYTAALMYVPALPVLKIALKIKKITTIGMMYNEKEDNAKKEMAMLIQGCKNLKLQSKTFPYSNENAITNTFKKMLDSGVECIVIPKDTLLAQHMDEIKPQIYAKKMLALALDDAPADRDLAVISLTAGNEEVGMLLGKKAVEILKGKKPAEIKMEALDKFYVTVNLKVAKIIGINIPVDVVRTANRIIKEE